MSARRALRRQGMTLIELLVVISIIITLAALAAAFMPRVQDSTRLSSAVDQFEQWLLTAKMRAKRDGLTTGVRLIPDGANPGMYSQFQYVQQPDPLSGGWLSTTPTPTSVPYGALYLTGGILRESSSGTVMFTNVDFTGGQSLPSGFLVQPGDYLEVRDSGVYLVGAVVGPTALRLGPGGSPTTYDVALRITQPTTNYRILRMPRPVLGENPLQMPGNLAVDLVSQDPIAKQTYSQALPGVSGAIDILFSPSGAVVGTNGSLGKVFLFVHDLTQNPVDTTRAGLVTVQTRTGFIGAYNVGPLGNPFAYANQGRTSGL